MEQENRIAVMAIIVENRDSVDELNTVLHEYGSFIVGRMCISCRLLWMHRMKPYPRLPERSEIFPESV